MTNLELIVERELTLKEIENIYHIIVEYAHVDYNATLNESENCVEISSDFQVSQEGHQFEYSLPLTEHTTTKNYDKIVKGIAKIIPDDFEFGVETR